MSVNFVIFFTCETSEKIGTRINFSSQIFIVDHNVFTWVNVWENMRYTYLPISNFSADSIEKSQEKTCLKNVKKKKILH